MFNLFTSRSRKARRRANRNAISQAQIETLQPRQMLTAVIAADSNSSADNDETGETATKTVTEASGRHWELKGTDLYLDGKLNWSGIADFAVKDHGEYYILKTPENAGWLRYNGGQAIGKYVKAFGIDSSDRMFALQENGEINRRESTGWVNVGRGFDQMVVAAGKVYGLGQSETLSVLHDDSWQTVATKVASIDLNGDSLVAHASSGNFTVQGTEEADTIRISILDDAFALITTDAADIHVRRSEVSQFEVHAGGGDDDIINSTEIPMIAYGGDGSDWLTGGKGDDRLFGEGGRDFIEGSQGNDVLDGGEGHDLLIGSNGRDVFNLDVNYEDSDVLDGGVGDDVLYGAHGNDLLLGGLGNDRISGGRGQDDINGGENEDELWAGDAKFSSWGCPLPDRDWDSNPRFDGIDGSRVSVDSDTLNGGSGNDMIKGDAGDDIIHGCTGDDLLHGWLGNDEIYGSAGNDRLFGHAGDDLLSGGDGDDYLEGWLGSDSLFGGNGDDFLTGTRVMHWESIRHAALNGLHYGFDLGVDFLDGGSGNDTYFVHFLRTSSDTNPYFYFVALTESGHDWSIENATSFKVTLISDNNERVLLVDQGWFTPARESMESGTSSWAEAEYFRVADWRILPESLSN